MVSLAPAAATALVDAEPAAPPRQPSTPAVAPADYYRLKFEAEKQAHRAYLDALPVNAWVAHFDHHFRITLDAATRMVAHDAAEVRTFIARATARGAVDVARALTNLLARAVPAMDVAAFGKGPAYPAANAAPEALAAWEQAYDDHQCRTVARARQRYADELGQVFIWAGEAAESGEAAEAARYAEIALHACGHVEPQGVSLALRQRTLADWQAAYAAEQAMIEADDSDDLQPMDGEHFVETQVLRTAADALSRGDRETARALLALRVQWGTEFHAANHPATEVAA